MFDKVKVLSTSEIIASKIKQKISDGTLKPGSKLPPERELAELFGVGRSSLREAIQVLKMIGLVEVRGGSKGGIFVTTSTAFNFSEIVRLMIEFDVTDWKEVLEVRKALEPFACKTAAWNRCDEDLARLEQNVQETQNSIHDHEQFFLLNTAFHILIFNASRNKLMSSLCETISALISKNGSELLKEQQLRRFVYEEHLQSFCDEHRQIARAIQEHNQELAYNLMEEHLLHAEDLYLGRIKGN